MTRLELLESDVVVVACGNFEAAPRPGTWAGHLRIRQINYKKKYNLVNSVVYRNGVSPYMYEW